VALRQRCHTAFKRAWRFFADGQTGCAIGIEDRFGDQQFLVRHRLAIQLHGVACDLASGVALGVDQRGSDQRIRDCIARGEFRALDLESRHAFGRAAAFEDGFSGGGGLLRFFLAMQHGGRNIGEAFLGVVDGGRLRPWRAR